MRSLFLIICLIPFGLMARSIDDFVKYAPEKNTCKCEVKSEDFSDRILLNAVQNQQIDDEHLLACTHHCLGVYYYKNQNYLKAISQNKIAVKIREQRQDPLLWKSYRNLGYAYTKISYQRKSMKAIFRAMELNENFQKMAMANIYVSRCYRDIGEYEKAIEYAQVALTLATTEEQQGEAYNNLSIIYDRMDIKESLLTIQYAQKAIKSYEKAQKKLKVANAYNNMANGLEALKQYEKAIRAYNKALAIYRKDDSFYYAKILNNIARILNKQKKYNEAIELLNESLTLKQKHHNALYHLDYFSNYEHLGDSYMGLNKFDVAEQFYEKSIDNLKDNPKTETPYIYNKSNYIHILDLKAQALKMNGDTDLAAQIYQDIDNWITTFYRDLSTNTSKLVWIERAHKIYGNAIEVALMTGDKERAFQYAEKAHAVLLWQNLSQEAALSLLSEDDRQKRDHLIAQLHQAERQYKNDNIDIRILRTREGELQAFEEQLEKDYPEYKNRKYQTESTTVAQVQDMIDENTAFIEYYWMNDVLQIFIITKEGFTVYTETAEGLADQITKLRSIISQSKCDAHCAKNAYNSLAVDLYKKLIPNDVQTNSEINRLVIVADKAIGTLPFAALATQVSTENFDVDYPFLLHKYATNYLYSAGSFLQLQQKNTHRTTGFAGFAPVEYHIADRNFLPLYRAEEEVVKIAEMYSSRRRKTYMKAEATKQNFIRVLQENYHTLLLATHAQYKNQKGEIAFQSEVMNQNEIDQLKEIRIQRLILSACQTAEGKQNAGEGILSLGWNFAYKGVPSITMNQWSVDEGATMKIMLTYNKLLRKGIPADQALQDAQISYLNGDIYSRKYYQPYYWAAIVHAGNPVDTKTGMGIDIFGNMINDEYLWWTLIALLIVMSWRVRIRRN